MFPHLSETSWKCWHLIPSVGKMVVGKRLRSLNPGDQSQVMLDEGQGGQGTRSHYMATPVCLPSPLPTPDLTIRIRNSQNGKERTVTFRTYGVSIQFNLLRPSSGLTRATAQELFGPNFIHLHWIPLPLYQFNSKPRHLQHSRHCGLVRDLRPSKQNNFHPRTPLVVNYANGLGSESSWDARAPAWEFNCYETVIFHFPTPLGGTEANPFFIAYYSIVLSSEWNRRTCLTTAYSRPTGINNNLLSIKIISFHFLICILWKRGQRCGICSTKPRTWILFI